MLPALVDVLEDLLDFGGELVLEDVEPLPLSHIAPQVLLVLLLVLGHYLADLLVVRRLPVLRNTLRRNAHRISHSRASFQDAQVHDLGQLIEHYAAHARLEGRQDVPFDL